jgi:hypothetical protein
MPEEAGAELDRQATHAVSWDRATWVVVWRKADE